MSRIVAEGQTIFGRYRVEVAGDRMVERVSCEEEAFARYLEEEIRAGKGWMANAYHPPAGTMLQAFALLQNIFGEDQVRAEGDIGEVPLEETGKDVIY